MGRSWEALESCSDVRGSNTAALTHCSFILELTEMYRDVSGLRSVLGGGCGFHLKHNLLSGESAWASLIDCNHKALELIDHGPISYKCN